MRQPKHPDRSVERDVPLDHHRGSAGFLRCLTLKAISKVRFLRDIDGCRYVWSVALLADGLSNPKWEQNNAYAEVVAREYYNLQGLRVERPESGIQRRWGNMPAACPYRPGKTLQHGNNNDVD